MDKGKPGKRVHSPLSIPYGLPILHCQKEGRKTQTMPRLLIPKRMDSEKRLPPPSNYQTRCAMGLQQHMD